MNCQQRRRRAPTPVNEATTVSTYEPDGPCPTCNDTHLWDPKIRPGVSLYAEPLPCPVCTAS